MSGGEIDGGRGGDVQLFEHALVFGGTGVGAGLGFEAGDEKGQDEEGQAPAGAGESFVKNVRTKRTKRTNSVSPLFYQDNSSFPALLRRFGRWEGPRYPDFGSRNRCNFGAFPLGLLFLFFLCEAPGQRFPSRGDLLRAGGNGANALKRTAVGAIGYGFAI